MDGSSATASAVLGLPEQVVEGDGMRPPLRQWAFAAIVIGTVLAVMDATVANVALPTIAAQFHASPASSIGIVSAYLLIIVVLLLPLSALGDIYGYRMIYIAGLAVFTVGSVACAASGSMLALSAARVLQGVGAAGIISVSSALTREIFPRGRLGAAIGMTTLVVALSSTIAPSFASAVLRVGPWNWLFAANVPLGVAAITIGWRCLPRDRRSGGRFDAPSAVLTAAMLGLAVTAIDSVSRGGGGGAHWPLAAAQIGAAVGAGVWAVSRQRGLPAPLLPIDLLRIPVVALSIGASIGGFIAQMLALVALPFLLEGQLGFKATTIGFLIMPWPLALAVVGLLSGHLSNRLSAGVLGLVGLLIAAGGMALLALLPAHPGVVDIGWRMAVCGAGFGLFQTPNTRTIITAGPKHRSGAAGGMQGTGRLLGQATGAALVGLLLAHFPLFGPVLALWLGAAFAVAASGLSVLRSLPRARDV